MFIKNNESFGSYFSSRLWNMFYTNNILLIYWDMVCSNNGAQIAELSNAEGIFYDVIGFIENTY